VLGLATPARSGRDGVVVRGESHQYGVAAVPLARELADVQLAALARTLLERETLDESEILAVTGLTRAPRLEDGKQPVSQAPDANRERYDSG
jgi:hypothetical protein